MSQPLTSNLRCNATACSTALHSMCTAVQTTFLATYGPCGRFLIRMPAGRDADATSASRHLFRCPHSHATCDTYLYKILAEVMRAQRAAFGEGTKFCAGMMAHLVLMAQHVDAPLPVVRRAFEAGVEWSLEGLEAAAEEVELREVGKVVRVARAVMAPRGMGDVARKVVDGFVGSLGLGEGGLVESGLRVVEIVGNEIEGCSVRRREVVLDVDLPASPVDFRRFEGRRVKIALYDVSLVMGGGAVMPDVETVMEGSEWHVGEVEREMLERLVTGLKEAGVDVVIAQKKVHPFAKVLLLSEGIVVLERLGRVNFAAALHISGGRMLSSLEAPEEEDLGVVDAIYVSKVMLDKYHVIMRNSQSNAVTLVLCAPDPSSMAELREATECALIALRSFIQDPTVVPGAGVIDVRLAQVVRRKLLSWKAENPGDILTARLLDGFAEALEFTAGALSKSQKVPPRQVIESIKASNEGWCAPFNGDGREEVLELHAAKASALKSAAQLAVTLYSIGGVIVDDR